MAQRYEGRPMSLENMRSVGVRNVYLDCECGHVASVNVDTLADDVFVPDVKKHGRCSKCGKRPLVSRPDWKTYKPPGSGTL